MQHVVEPVHFVSSSRMNLSFYGLLIQRVVELIHFMDFTI